MSFSVFEVSDLVRKYESLSLFPFKNSIKLYRIYVIARVSNARLHCHDSAKSISKQYSLFVSI